MTGASIARSVKVLTEGETRSESVEHTLTVGTSSIDTGTCDKHVMNYRENAFASHPASITIFNLAVVQHSGFIQLDGSAVYRLCEAEEWISGARSTHS